jgi:hypothetical protein
MTPKGEYSRYNVGNQRHDSTYKGMYTHLVTYKYLRIVHWRDTLNNTVVLAHCVAEHQSIPTFHCLVPLYHVLVGFQK